MPVNKKRKKRQLNKELKRRKRARLDRAFRNIFVKSGFLDE